jgi:hypothetical protein
MGDGESTMKTQVASDIVRDGLGVELVSASGDVLAEVFRCDADHTVVFNAFARQLPLAAVRMLIDRALCRLDPFEDGTPLVGKPDAH